MGDYILQLRDKVGPEMVLQMPSVSVGARDGDGKLLMIRHAEGGRWLLPGGSVEPGERPADTALRETWEETGFRVGLMRLVGVYGGSEFVVRYRNDERVSYVMAVFEARVESGAPRPDEKETLEMGFFEAADLDGLDLARWVPPVLNELLADSSAGFQASTWTPPA